MRPISPLRSRIVLRGRSLTFGRFLGSLPVTLHDLRAFDAYLADFADGQRVAVVVGDHEVGARHRQPDRPVETLLERIRGRDRGGFCESVALQDRPARDLFPLFRYRRLHGHSTANADPQAAEVQAGETRCVEQRREQRVDAGQEVEPVFAELGDKALRVPRVGDQNVLAAHRGDGQAVRL